MLLVARRCLSAGGSGDESRGAARGNRPCAGRGRDDVGVCPVGVAPAVAAGDGRGSLPDRVARSRGGVVRGESTRGGFAYGVSDNGGGSRGGGYARNRTRWGGV